MTFLYFDALIKQNLLPMKKIFSSLKKVCLWLIVKYTSVGLLEMIVLHTALLIFLIVFSYLATLEIITFDFAVRIVLVGSIILITTFLIYFALKYFHYFLVDTSEHTYIDGTELDDSKSTYSSYKSYKKFDDNNEVPDNDIDYGESGFPFCPSTRNPPPNLPTGH